jgi:hypothetical protein
MDIYKRAMRKKLKFQTSRGVLSTEDMFDIKVEELDKWAIALNKKIKAEEGESYRKDQKQSSTQSTDDKLRLDLLVDIINTKEKDAETAEKAIATKQRKARLAELIAEKKDEDLKDMSVEELEAMHADL